MTDILIPAVCGLFGVGLGAILNYRISKQKINLDSKKVSHDGLQIFLDRIEKDNERLRERELKNEEDIKFLKAQVETFRGKLLLLEQAHHNLPIPQWMKSNSGEILSMNSHCHEVFIRPFGISRVESIGLKDRDIFPLDTALMIEEHDANAKKQRKSIRTTETLEIAGKKQKWAVMRYPIIHDGTVIAVGGIAYELIKE